MKNVKKTKKTRFIRYRSYRSGLYNNKRSKSIFLLCILVQLPLSAIFSSGDSHLLGLFHILCVVIQFVLEHQDEDEH